MARAAFSKSLGKLSVDDWRVLSGIIFANRKGRRWRDALKDYGQHNRSTMVGSGEAKGRSGVQIGRALGWR